jgi:hypothetical protein
VKQPQVAQTKSVDITYHIYTLPRIFSIPLELLSYNPGALSFLPGGGNVNAKSVQEPFQYMLKHSRTKLLLRLNVFIGCPDNSKKKKRRVTPNDLVTAFGKFCREAFRGRSEYRKPPEITSSRTTNEKAVIAVRRIASLELA